MYKVKSKEGFNVILKDLGLTLRPHGDWTYISKSDFDNSRDAKKMLNFIIKENASSVEEKVKKDKKTKNIIQVNDGAFVVEGRTYKNPDDVFVARPTPSEQTELKEVPAEENLVEENPVEVVEVQSETSETEVNPTTIKSEKKTTTQKKNKIEKNEK